MKLPTDPDYDDYTVDPHPRYIDSKKTACPRCKHEMWDHTPPQSNDHDGQQGCEVHGCHCLVVSIEISDYMDDVTD
jgi:hypothetical protein